MPCPSATRPCERHSFTALVGTSFHAGRQMIWGIVYLLCLIAVSATVFSIGDRESRAAITTVMIGSLMTIGGLFLSSSRFDVFSLLVASVDIFILFVFFFHALISRRYWTLCLPAFQLISCVTHVAKIVAPEIVPRVYSAGQGFWAYPIMLVILGAAAWTKVSQIRPSEVIPHSE